MVYDPFKLKRTLETTTLFVIVFGVSTAQAYPEFQRTLQKESGRIVSCGMCHAHPDGPDGVKHGQIGSLSETQVRTLNHSRSMLEPGPVVDSPILNPFGDYLVSHLGRKRILGLKPQPTLLKTSLDQKHDLDADGIPDARELRDGTDPGDNRHGDPLLLFLWNLRVYGFHIVMISFATLFGLWGLSRFFSWLSYETEQVSSLDRRSRRSPPSQN
jgi:hypothetical protein